MRATTLLLAGGAALLFSSTLPAPALATGPLCTVEQESAYAPYEPDDGQIGCDYWTFETCTDDCLTMYQAAVQHAPDCRKRNWGRVYDTFLERATSSLERCEKVRANTTNKYFPQLVAGAPECNLQVYFNDNTTFDNCAFSSSTTCTDECLKVIEDGVSSAPFCRKGGDYTVGEARKQYLVACLWTRGEDLASNQALQTVMTSGSNPGSSLSIWTSAVIAGAAVLVIVLAYTCYTRRRSRQASNDAYAQC